MTGKMTDEEKQLDNTQSQPDEATDGSAAAADSAEPQEEAIASGGEAEQQPANEAGTAEAEAPSSEEVPPSAEPPSAATVEEMASMEALILANQAFTAQIEDLKSQYARLAADFDNFRKRTQKEKEELDLQAKCATIRELLPVVDNFERAKEQIKPQNDGEMNIHKSYLSVYKQMVDCLKRIGVSAMYPKGEPFDPNLHEAVMREATADHEEGTVMEEFRRGYMLGDRVLRHAMVKVAAAPEPVVPSEENSPESTEEQ